MNQTAAFAIALTLVGCAVAPINTDYSLIDPRGVDMAKYSSDYSDCARLADQTDVGSRAATGAVLGSLIGAVIGGVLCGRGCVDAGARGGLVGGTAGAFSSGVSELQTTLRACLIGRGYRVIR